MQKPEATNSDISLKYFPAENLKPISAELILKKDIESEFNMLNSYTLTSEHEKQLERRSQFQDLNRYSNVLPYKKNLVRSSLDPLSLENYINANMISHPFDPELQFQFIATQGPLEETTETFWEMIKFFKVPLVTAIIESKAFPRACARYWPTKSPMELTNLTINQKSGLQNDLWNTSEISIKSKNEEHKIEHCHFYNWIDHEALSDSFYSLYVQYLEKLWVLKQANPNTPVVIHCSAGIGRTGTLMASYFLYDQFKQCQKKNKPLEFSILAIARHLREQRHGAIQTLKQYTFLYRIIQYFK